MAIIPTTPAAASRAARSRSCESGVDVEVVEYLKQPLDRAQLERLLALLPDPAPELVRKDKNFAELG